MKNRKPFDAYLYEKNDKIAREVTKRAFLINYDYVLQDNPDQYGPDLKAYQNGEFIGYVETEIKQFWKDHKSFPDAFVHIPERKKKFLQYYDRPDQIVPIIFCVLSADLKGGYWIDGEALGNCMLINKPNKYMAEERFFDIPLMKMQYFNTEKRDEHESIKSQSSQ